MGKKREKCRRKGRLKPRVDYVIYSSPDGSKYKFYFSNKSVRKIGGSRA